MPRFTLATKNVETEDLPDVGPTLANLSHCDKNWITLADGFIITTNAFAEIRSSLLTDVTQANLNSTSSSHKNIIRFFHGHLNLSAAAQEEIDKQAKHLHFPLKVKAFTQFGKKDWESFETLVLKKTELNQALKNAVGSAFQKEIMPSLSAENLTKLNQAILVEEKIDPEISGKVTVSPKIIKVYSQWGEFFESASSDLAIFAGSKDQPESYNVALQERQVIFRSGKFKHIPVGKNYQFVNKLTQTQLEKLVKLARRLAASLIVDFEFYFTISNEKIYLSDLAINKTSEKLFEETRFLINLNLYRHLRPVLPGIASGIARHIEKSSEFKKLRRGDIAIVKGFHKKVLPELKKSSGIILSQAKDLTRENLVHLKKLGKATISGEIDRLTNRMVTIDGKSGKVYLGAFPPPYIKRFEPNPNIELEIQIKSATKTFVAINKVSDLEELIGEDFTGIGPVDGAHFFPKRNLIDSPLTVREKNDSLARLEAFLTQVATTFPDKPLLYSPASLTDNHETQNIHLLKEELSTIAHLRNKKYLKNLWLSLPNIQSVEHYKEVKGILKDLSLQKSPTFKILLSVTTPAEATQIKDYISEGIDGAIIDYYDLACLVYGKDLTTSQLNSLDGAAVLPLIEQVVSQTRLEGLFSAVDNLVLDNQKLVNQVISFGTKAIICPASFLAKSNQSAAIAEGTLVKNKTER